MAWLPKRPNEILDYSLDFSDVLGNGVQIKLIQTVEVLQPSTVNTYDRVGLSQGTFVSLRIATPTNVLSDTEEIGAGGGSATLIVRYGNSAAVSGILVNYGVGKPPSDQQVIARLQAGTAGMSYTVRAVVQDENGRVHEKRETLIIRSD